MPTEWGIAALCYRCQMPDKEPRGLFRNYLQRSDTHVCPTLIWFPGKKKQFVIRIWSRDGFELPSVLV